MRHRPQTADVEERLPSILQEPLPRPESELAESHYFAMSLVPLLHKLDRNKRHQAKIGILNVLQNIESSTDSGQRPTPTFHTPTSRPGTTPCYIARSCVNSQGLVGPRDVMAAPQRTTVAEAVGIGGRRNTQPTRCAAVSQPFRIQWKSRYETYVQEEITYNYGDSNWPWR
ncbi:Hypothetical protein SMAX5B_001408 [Scophthalmus maximus]|uniref:BESS domain-containing protein n=1 Tax=Scophthalmus maximus TaxID=52904 RepID=A0A2U9CP24_SCOMX|nr:Hypothetical protein SMAX5B_001408 [Scophthalmus maximus]